MRAESAHQLVQARQADLRVLERAEVQKLFELFFELLFDLFLPRQHDFPAGALQHVGNVISPRLALGAVFCNQHPAKLLDLSGREAWRTDSPRCIENQFLLGFDRLVHRPPFCEAFFNLFFRRGCFFGAGAGGAGSGSAGSPAISR
jgi:hypothetical protein